jgi:predicted NBD/HSP70 family sugar kinase
MSGVYLALDIGGTKTAAASADACLKIQRRLREPTPPGLAEGLEMLHRMIAELSGGRKVEAIAASAGGPLDWRSGVVSPLHQAAWRDVPLRAIMEERWGCPFFVDVDTNLAALGEYRAVAGQVGSLLYLTLSTGMGGGWIVDGRIYRGMGGSHPEVGHQAVPFRCAHPERVVCACGAPGCLEALVSGRGIARIYGHPAERLSEPEWAEVGYNLGQGLRNLATILMPDEIVLGGGVAIGGGDRLLAAATSAMRTGWRLIPAMPTVRLSVLGEDAPLLGALAIARDGAA